jgi:hypothetical protein
MRMYRVKRVIIGCLALCVALALGGCSAVRLSYNNGAQLAWWWLDDYVDFSREQTPAARLAVDRWFEWHRASQLAGYAEVLVAAQAQMGEPLTPALACRWWDRLREAVEPALDRGLVDFAELVPGLREPQWRSIEKRYAKTVDQMRADHLQPDAAVRQQESLKRTLERVERLYGAVDEAQRRSIAAAVAASPFNPELWITERQRRQRDAIQTLRRLAAERADRDQRIAALRVLVQRTELSPDTEYRAYQQRLSAYNCAFAAQIHNAMSPAQRQKARETLKGWEDDLRSLLPPAS